MREKSFIDMIAEKTGISKADVEKVLRAWEEIKKEIEEKIRDEWSKKIEEFMDKVYGDEEVGFMLFQTPLGIMVVGRTGKKSVKKA